MLFTILAVKSRLALPLSCSSTGEARVFEGRARYVGSGHVVFGHRTSSGRSVSTRLASDPGSGAPGPRGRSLVGRGLSAVRGRRRRAAYIRANQASAYVGKSVLAVVNRQGAAEILPLPPDNYFLAALSPAADRLVVQVGPAAICGRTTSSGHLSD